MGCRLWLAALWCAAAAATALPDTQLKQINGKKVVVFKSNRLKIPKTPLPPNASVIAADKVFIVWEATERSNVIVNLSLGERQFKVFVREQFGRWDSGSVVDGNSSSFVMTGLRPQTAYSFAVQQIDKGLKSNVSAASDLVMTSPGVIDWNKEVEKAWQAPLLTPKCDHPPITDGITYNPNDPSPREYTDEYFSTDNPNFRSVKPQDKVAIRQIDVLQSAP